MKISCQTTLFFDASALVAGSHSREGGSALLLEACQRGGFAAQSSFLVILEALHAVRENLPRQSLNRLRDYLAGIDWRILPVPREEDLQKYSSFVQAKDVHVLAAAVEGGSEFLLTLDRRHLLAAAEAVEAAHLPIRILRPGDFIHLPESSSGTTASVRTTWDQVDTS